MEPTYNIVLNDLLLSELKASVFCLFETDDNLNDQDIDEIIQQNLDFSFLQTDGPDNDPNYDIKQQFSSSFQTYMLQRSYQFQTKNRPLFVAIITKFYNETNYITYNYTCITTKDYLDMFENVGIYMQSIENMSDFLSRSDEILNKFRLEDNLPDRDIDIILEFLHDTFDVINRLNYQEQIEQKVLIENLKNQIRYFVDLREIRNIKDE